jgi:signal recognition particle subunit SRP54
VFEKIAEKLRGAMRALRGLNTITEKNITGALRSVRDALLDADVSFEVVKAFLEDVREKALGQKVVQSIDPGQQLIKIIHDALTELLGGECKLSEQRPLRVMVVGLNGSGKTTTALKLAKYLKRKDYEPLLVACDLHRPAAIDQLEQLAAESSLPCYVDRKCQSAKKVVSGAMVEAEKIGATALIFDTAGRLQVDSSLMDELVELHGVAEPNETFLVVDAAIGQEAVAVAKAFSGHIPLTGAILTKTDGDSRGGAALSMKYAAGIPVSFVGTGERADDLDAFRAEGMANRILGMGDVVALVERANERVDRAEADRISRRIKKAEFDLDDYLSQMEQIEKMGSVGSLMKLLPGAGAGPIPKKELEMLDRTKAIVRAMTAEERKKPQMVCGSRKTRIARGSGTELKDVNHVLKQFDRMKKGMKTLKTQQGKAMLQKITAQNAVGQIARLFGGK